MTEEPMVEGLAPLYVDLRTNPYATAMRSSLLAAVLILTSCHSGQANDPPPKQRDSPQFTKARAAVLAAVRDPDSAKFGAFTHGRGAAVCGSVNARNGFGGYEGEMPFAWSAATGVILYDYPTGQGDWHERGRIAEQFEELGCSIGPDQAKAIAAKRAIDEVDRKIAAGE